MSIRVKWKTSIKGRKTFWIFLIVVILMFVIWEWNGQMKVETEQTWTPINQDLAAVIDLDMIADSSRSLGPVNINLAGEEELTRLPGIGPAKAQAIIAYREEHGHFVNVEDVIHVPGIGPATLEQMKDMILLEEAPTQDNQN